MIRVPSRPLRLIAAAVAIGVLGTACGSGGGSAAKGKVLDSTTTTTIAKGADTTAAVLRSTLNGLLEEHVYLASAGRAGSAELMKAPKSFVYWVRSLTAWADLAPSWAASPCV